MKKSHKHINEDWNYEDYIKKDPRYKMPDPRAEETTIITRKYYPTRLDEKRIVKVNKAHTLNEDMGLATGITAGTSGTDLYNNGFSYEIKPLTSNLSQKGNDPSAENRNNSFKHFIGDVVKGYCPYDKKLHKGMIKYLYYKDSKSPVPMYVYIQDFTDESIVPLEADTLKNYKTVQIDDEKLFKNPYIQNPWQARETQIDHDFAAVSAPIKEALELDDDGLTDTTPVFHQDAPIIEDYLYVLIKHVLVPYLRDQFVPTPEIIDIFKQACDKNELAPLLRLSDVSQLLKVFTLLKRAFFKSPQAMDVDLNWIDISKLNKNIIDTIKNIPLLKGINSIDISSWTNENISKEEIVKWLRIRGVENIIY